MRQPLRLMVDMDEIIVNCLAPWLRAYNQDYGTDLKVGDLRDWDFKGVLDERCRDIHHYIRQPGFFAALQPLPGALETLGRLAALKTFYGKKILDIVICTATRTPGAAQDKLDWFNQHLAFCGKRNFFIGHRKNWLKADVYIDDGPHNIQDIRTDWPSAHILTIAYPYNESVQHLTNIRADGWSNPEAAWLAIESYIWGLLS